METNTTVENLRAEHARLDAIIREEESHIWKNLIRIEELKLTSAVLNSEQTQ